MKGFAGRAALLAALLGDANASTRHGARGTGGLARPASSAATSLVAVKASLNQCRDSVGKYQEDLTSCLRDSPKPVCNCFCPTCAPELAPCTTTAAPTTTTTTTTEPAVSAMTVPPAPPLAPLHVIKPLTVDYLPTIGPLPTVSPVPGVALVSEQRLDFIQMQNMYGSSELAYSKQQLEDCRFAEEQHLAELQAKGCADRSSSRRSSSSWLLRVSRIMPAECDCSCPACDFWREPGACFKEGEGDSDAPPAPPPADDGIVPTAPPPQPTPPRRPPELPMPALPPVGTEFLPTLDPVIHPPGQAPPSWAHPAVAGPPGIVKAR